MPTENLRSGLFYARGRYAPLQTALMRCRMVARMLAKEPDDRYQTPRELMKALGHGEEEQRSTRDILQSLAAKKTDARPASVRYAVRVACEILAGMTKEPFA